MGYELDYDAEMKIIRGRVEGELNSSIVRSMALDLAKLGRRHKCTRLLNDLREAVISKSIIDVYGFPREVERAGIKGSFRRAIVVNPPLDDFRFLETVSINQGQEIRIFLDLDEALLWLVGKSS